MGAIKNLVISASEAEILGEELQQLRADVIETIVTVSKYTAEELKSVSTEDLGQILKEMTQ